MLQFIHTLPRDGVLLFATRGTRMFAYGFLSVVLVLYLKAQGLEEQQIGVLLTMTLLGDMVISLWITTAADRIGRKRMLILGAGAHGPGRMRVCRYRQLSSCCSLSPRSACSARATRKSGHFSRSSRLPLPRQFRRARSNRRLCLVQPGRFVDGRVRRTRRRFRRSRVSQARHDGRSNLSTAHRGVRPRSGSYWHSCSLALSHAAETPNRNSPRQQSSWLGLHRSRGVVLRLSALFALDAFGGGFILQSIVAYWLYIRFQLDPACWAASSSSPTCSPPDRHSVRLHWRDASA